VATSSQARVSVPSDVLVQQLGDGEMVFLNLATEEYFGLGRTGARMWAALAETGSVVDALERLDEEFAVEKEVLRRDLDRLIDRLTARGLLRVGALPEGTSAQAPPE
jgi:hypothetical protein